MIVYLKILEIQAPITNLSFQRLVNPSRPMTAVYPIKRQRQRVTSATSGAILLRAARIKGIECK